MPDSVMPPVRTFVGPRWELIAVHGGYDISTATVARMLDENGDGRAARILHSGQPVSFGSQPVIVAPTTAFAALSVEHLVRSWHAGVPRPWLVLVADVPAPEAPAARFRLRALESRLAGVARVPYLPVLRAVEGPEEALRHKDVKAAAEKLRRQLEG